MELAMKAIETTGIVDQESRLLLDKPLPIVGPSRVRVIILVPEETDMTEQEWLYAASRNPALDFLKEPEEDIYSLADGKPFHDQGQSCPCSFSFRRSIDYEGAAGSLPD
jgi:hypothetical protein